MNTINTEEDSLYIPFIITFDEYLIECKNTGMSLEEAHRVSENWIKKDLEKNNLSFEKFTSIYI